MAFNDRVKISSTVPEKRRFAVIVPAHNEETVILKTIDNLFHIDYPVELFDVIVIADNCTDSTSEIARSMGAIIMERTDPDKRGKGFALEWCFNQLVSNKTRYDAFVVIDADTSVSGNILEVMNRYIESGASVIQCSDLVMQTNNSWSSEIIRLSFQLNNYVKLLGKRNLGCTAGLRGNGMCFTTGLLRRNPWRAYSQTEDLEYGLMLLLKGTRVMFAPEATVKALMPIKASTAESQRARWELGRFPLIKKYSILLFNESVKQKSLPIFEAFLDLVTPAFVNIFAFSFFMVVLDVILLFFRFDEVGSLYSGWLVLFLLQIIYVITGLYASNANKEDYAALLIVPKYIIWKFWLYIKLAFTGHTKIWIRTERDLTKNDSFIKRSND